MQRKLKDLADFCLENQTSLRVIVINDYSLLVCGTGADVAVNGIPFIDWQ